MTPLEKEYQQLILDKMLANWPASAPAPIAHLSKQQARQALKAYQNALPMPDAELTEDLAACRRVAIQAATDGFQAFKKTGEILLEMKRRVNEDEFRAWMAKYVPAMTMQEAEFAMRAAAS